MKRICLLTVFLLLSMFSVLKVYAGTSDTVILLIDVSQSTSEINLDIFQAATEIVKLVPLGDEVTLIKFDTQPQLVTSLVVQNETDKAMLYRILRSYTPSGKYTDIACALEEAYENCLTHKDKGKKKIVVLLSDGKISPAPSSKYYARGEIKKQEKMTEEIVNSFAYMDWKVIVPKIGNLQTSFERMGINTYSFAEIETLLKPRKQANKLILPIVISLISLLFLFIKKKVKIPGIELRLIMEGKRRYEQTFVLSHKKWLTVGSSLSDFPLDMTKSVLKISQFKKSIFLEPISNETVRVNGNPLRGKEKVTKKENIVTVKDKTMILTIEGRNEK